MSGYERFSNNQSFIQPGFIVPRDPFLDSASANFAIDFCSYRVSAWIPGRPTRDAMQLRPHQLHLGQHTSERLIDAHPCENFDATPDLTHIHRLRMTSIHKESAVL